MADTPPIRATIGLPPDKTVQAFRARDDLRTTVRWSEMWEADHSRAFTVAKVANTDLLATIRGSLDDMLAKGGTFEQWQAGLVPELQKAGWWGMVDDKTITGADHPVFVGGRRLRTIYNTNLRMSRAAGQWHRIQALKGTRPFLMYVSVRDTHTRPLHRRWGGNDPAMPIRIILPVDHPCWAIFYPPNDWGCRCTVRQLSQRELDRNGWRVTTDAELIRVGWLTADGQPGGPRRNFFRAGSKTPVAVPVGIGPGFGYNPGRTGMAALTDKLTASIEVLAQADSRAAAAALKAVLNSDVMGEVLKEPSGSYPLMVLDAAIVEAAGLARHVARFTPERLARQVEQGRSLPAATYIELVDLPLTADLVGIAGPQVVTLARQIRDEWLAVTLAGAEPVVSTVQMLSHRSLNKRLAGQKIVRDRQVRSLDDALPDLLAAPREVPLPVAIGRTGDESPPDIAGFIRTIGSQEVRHAIETHAGDKHPVTEQAIRMIPTIIANGRRVDKVHGDTHEQMFVLERDGIYYVYVERVGRRQHRVTMRTLYLDNNAPNLAAGLKKTQTAMRDLDDALPDLLGPASRPVAATIGRAAEESAPDFQGFARTIASTATRRMLDAHGSDVHPVTEATLRSIPTIVAKGRRIDRVEAGKPEQVFVHEQDGAFAVYVERVDRGRQRLIARDLYLIDVLSSDLAAALARLLLASDDADDDDNEEGEAQ